MTCYGYPYQSVHVNFPFSSNIPIGFKTSRTFPALPSVLHFLLGFFVSVVGGLLLSSSASELLLLRECVHTNVVQSLFSVIALTFAESLTRPSFPLQC